MKSLEFKLLILCAVTILSCNFKGQIPSNDNQVKNCQEVRNGKFVLEDKKLNHKSIITRNDSIQTEEVVPGGMKGEFKVEWLDDCQYSLEPLSIDKSHPMYMILIVEIDKIVGDMLHCTIYPKDNKTEEMIKRFKMKVIE